MILFYTSYHLQYLGNDEGGAGGGGDFDPERWDKEDNDDSKGKKDGAGTDVMGTCRSFEFKSKRPFSSFLFRERGKNRKETKEVYRRDYSQLVGS